MNGLVLVLALALGGVLIFDLAKSIRTFEFELENFPKGLRVLFCTVWLNTFFGDKRHQL